LSESPSLRESKTSTVFDAKSGTGYLSLISMIKVWYEWTRKSLYKNQSYPILHLMYEVRGTRDTIVWD